MPPLDYFSFEAIYFLPQSSIFKLADKPEKAKVIKAFLKKGGGEEKAITLDTFFFCPFFQGANHSSQLREYQQRLKKSSAAALERGKLC